MQLKASRDTSLKNIVPNLSPPIEQTFSERRETGGIGTLSHSSFRWRGSRLFNSLPPAIRNINKKCGVEFFKRELDYFLCTLPDNPCVPHVDNDLTKMMAKNM